MSHDDIRAALESRTDLPWRPSHDGPVATRPSDTYDVLDNDGETVAASLFYLDAHLIANAPTWLTELLAEVDRLARWKAEAFPVIAGLQELGAELGIPLGKRITGPDALAAVKALTARAEAAEQTIQRVRAIHYAADNDVALTPVCSNCEGKAGVHDCGCWADEDRQPVCGHCKEGWKGSPVDYPCETIRALDGGAS